MAKLNPQQQAVMAHGDAPALVIAGAGTGKTTVMAHRAAELIRRGQNPNRLLLLTFTRRSAEELRHRVAKVLNSGELTLPWCGTFHSTAARLLRRYGDAIAVHNTFSIFDETDARDLLMKSAEATVDEALLEELPAKGMLYRIYSYALNTGQELEAVLSSIAAPHLRLAADLRRVYAAYNARKRAANALDFDDLLVRWLELLRSPQCDCARLFDSILVDEYQDTNVLQSQILKELCRHHSRIMVVGDDAQAIYAFRGATIKNILAFEKDFNGTAVLKLEENYRSHQQILDAANALLADAAEGGGYEKNLQAARGVGTHRPRLETVANDWQQAERIGELIKDAWESEGIPLREQAVLFRASHHTFRLEMALRRLGIPFKKFGGQRFADSAHIKDVFTFLRCRENPLDEAAWRRLLCLLPGVGDSTAGRLFERIVKAGDAVSVLREAKFAKAAAPYQADLVTVFELLHHPDATLEEQLTGIIFFYEPLLAKLYDTPDQRKQGLKELQNLAGNYTSRREFLDDMQVGDDSLLDAGNTGAPQDYLTISTIHSAKGCEWRLVCIMQCVEGGLPSGPSQEDDAKIDEERRLLYVAMTRAKERLYLFVPQWRETFDKGERGMTVYKPSRFLTPEVLACLDTGDKTADDDPDDTSDRDLIYERDDDTPYGHTAARRPQPGRPHGRRPVHY